MDQSEKGPYSDTSAASAVRRDAWGELPARIGRRLARAEARERAECSRAGRRERVPRLLRAATWDTDGVHDDLRDDGVAHPGDETTDVLIVDAPGSLKKGWKSCGVARQYTGTAGAG